MHATPAEAADTHRPSNGYRIALNGLALVSAGWWVVSVPHFATALQPLYGTVMCWPAATVFPLLTWVLADHTHRLRQRRTGRRTRQALAAALAFAFALVLSFMTYPLDNPGHGPWPVIAWMAGMHTMVGYTGPLMIIAPLYDDQGRRLSRATPREDQPPHQPSAD
ncbi:hypothetical protein [Kitasatospora aburaviensis]|uniref:Uncharacterized protein n=1 Tax=Kitasatospora aburaviensis TaxID=67265 RepID=A0ABW1EXA3_9ACTN